MPLFSWLHTMLSQLRDRTAPTRPHRYGRDPHFSTESITLWLERLEERIVLDGAGAADLSGLESETVDVEVLDGRHVRIDAGTAADDGTDDSFSVLTEGSTLSVLVNDQLVFSAETASIGSLTLAGSSDSDLFLIDSSGSSFAFELFILADGDTSSDSLSPSAPANDQLRLTGAPASAVLHQLDSTGGVSRLEESVVHWQGIEQLADSVAAGTRRIALASGGNELQLAAGDQPGWSVLTVTGGPEISFLAPGHSLEIDLNSPAGDTIGPAGDQLTISSLNSTAGSELAISADSADNVTFASSNSGAFQLDLSRLHVEAGTIDIETSVQLSAAAEADLDAFTLLTISESGGLTTTGGSIELTAPQLEHHGSLSASGGTVILDAGPAGTLTTTGLVDVSSHQPGGTGGTVHVLGHTVRLLEQAAIDATGASGGGTVLIGGDRSGRDSGITTAFTTILGAEVTVSADALEQGHGGTIIVWADDTALVHGSGGLSARGGSVAGDGGFIETSGKRFLKIGQAVDATATHGAAGLWLLDPRNVTITAGGGEALAGGELIPTGDDSEISAATIVAALEAGTNVSIYTGDTGTQAGNITVDDAITVDENEPDVILSLIAAGDIIVNQAITSSSGTLSVVLNANSTGGGTNDDLSPLVGDVTLNADITTNGGSFESTGVAFNGTGGAITTGAGAATLTHTGTVTLGSMTVGDTLTVTAGGAISQTARLAVTGNASFAAGANALTLDHADNAFTGSVALANSGANNVILVNSTALDLAASSVGSGTLTITGAGITQSGAITQAADAGTATFTVTAADADVLLADAANVLTGDIAIVGDGLVRDVELRNAAADAAFPLLPAGIRNLVLILDNDGISLPAVALSGNLTIQAAGDITQSAAVDLPGTTSLTSTGGDILLTTAENDFAGAVTVQVSGAKNAQLTDENAIELGASSLGTGTLTVEAVDVTVSGTLDLAGGNVALSATSQINVNAEVGTDGGSIEMSAGRDLLLAATAELLSGGGDITLTADALAGNDGGQFTQTDGSQINAAGGEVVISADGNATVSSVATSDGGGITVTSTSGSLIDGGDTHVDLVASDGLVNLTAAGSVGGAGDGEELETRVASLQAAAGSGSVHVLESDGLRLDDISAAGVGSDVVISSTTGNIVVGQVEATDLVILTAADGSILDGNDSGIDITADGVLLDATDGVGTGDPLEILVSVLAARSEGGISITGTGGATLEIGTVAGVSGVISTGAGNITLSHSGTLLISQEITATSGQVTLTTSGQLQLNHTTTATSIVPSAGVPIQFGGGVFSTPSGTVASHFPVLQNLDSSAISSEGAVVVTGSFGSAGESGYLVTVHWGDGKIDQKSFSSPGSFQFDHSYLLLPAESESLGYVPIRVTVQRTAAVDLPDSITKITQATVPSGGVTTVGVVTEEDLPQLVFPENALLQLDSSDLTTVSVASSTAGIDSAQAENSTDTETAIMLHVLDSDGAVLETVVLSEDVLDDLPQLFGRLPDGRYAIMIREAGEQQERLVMDVTVRQGKAAEGARDERTRLATGNDAADEADTNGEEVSTSGNVTKLFQHTSTGELIELTGQSLQRFWERWSAALLQVRRQKEAAAPGIPVADPQNAGPGTTALEGTSPGTATGQGGLGGSTSEDGTLLAFAVAGGAALQMARRIRRRHAAQGGSTGSPHQHSAGTRLKGLHNWLRKPASEGQP
ncbi:MAG: hypothetical protein KDA79_02575 [Planctomycetaceae bacterium]|nr:hypothetical protein [Planctomycetaceae bacterium]